MLFACFAPEAEVTTRSERRAPCPTGSRLKAPSDQAEQVLTSHGSVADCRDFIGHRSTKSNGIAVLPTNFSATRVSGRPMTACKGARLRPMTRAGCLSSLRKEEKTDTVIDCRRINVG